MLNLSAQQLRQAANLKEQIAGLEKQLAAILGSGTEAEVKPVKKGGMSAAGRARIAAAAKLRWAKVRAAKGKSVAEKVIKAVKNSAKPAVVVKPAKKKFKMSAAAKAKLSALMKARWAAKKK